jgi:hypothetical protein
MLDSTGSSKLITADEHMMRSGISAHLTPAKNKTRKKKQEVLLVTYNKGVVKYVA